MTNAEWAILGVIVGTIGTGFFNWLFQCQKFKHEKEMYLLQNKSSETVKSLLSDMLNQRTYVERSFTALKDPIGGFSDVQIQQFLHELGAKKIKRQDKSEWWYLISRQSERVK